MVRLLPEVGAAGRDDPLRRGKRQAARWFFRHELPRTEAQFALLESVDRSALDFDPAGF